MLSNDLIVSSATYSSGFFPDLLAIEGSAPAVLAGRCYLTGFFFSSKYPVFSCVFFFSPVLSIAILPTLT